MCEVNKGTQTEGKYYQIKGLNPSISLQIVFFYKPN